MSTDTKFKLWIAVPIVAFLALFVIGLVQQKPRGPGRVVESPLLGGDDAFSKYRETVKSPGFMPGLVNEVRRGAVDGQVIITVSSAWSRLSIDQRREKATALWRRWAREFAPDKPDSARIKIKDSAGHELAGSRVLAGSLIWVEGE